MDFFQRPSLRWGCLWIIGKKNWLLMLPVLITYIIPCHLDLLRNLFTYHKYKIDMTVIQYTTMMTQCKRVQNLKTRLILLIYIKNYILLKTNTNISAEPRLLTELCISALQNVFNFKIMNYGWQSWENMYTTVYV